MWGISILADFRPMGYIFHAVVVFALGKNLLFKFALGHCGALERGAHKSQTNKRFSNDCRIKEQIRRKPYLPKEAEINLLMEFLDLPLHNVILRKI